MDFYQDTLPLSASSLSTVYQLYALMSNKRTKAQDGLHFAALATLEWLQHRVGYALPPCPNLLPPERCRDVTASSLPSFFWENGYTVHVLSLCSKGCWTLRLTEPTADRGQTVTEIGFRIQNTDVECGFSVRSSEPNPSRPAFPLPCFSLIDRLAQSPDFGLTQIYPLSGTVSHPKEPHEIKKALSLLSDEKNRLPTVFFTAKSEEEAAFRPCDLLMPAALSSLTYTPDSASVPRRSVPSQKSYSCFNLGKKTLFFSKKDSNSLPPLPPSSDTATDTAIQQIETFARQARIFCRTVLLEDNLTRELEEGIGQKLPAGSIIVIQPATLGGTVEVLPYLQSQTKYTKQLQELAERLAFSSAAVPYNFGGVCFLQDATALLSDAIVSAPHLAKKENAQKQTAQQMEQLKKSHQDELKRRDRSHDALARQSEQLKEQIDRLGKEKEQLLRQQQQERDSFAHRIQARDEEVAYLRRTLTRPTLHTDIVGWARTNFSDHLFMHSRTEGLLSQNSARSVDIGLICDALDFLATDYWEFRYKQLPEAEMRRRCSEKYNRPFEPKQINDLAIQMTPREYKLKYQMTGTTKSREYALDWHVGVGSDPQTLLRIYFFHDDAGQKIVIGSLPHHLTAVKLQ